MYVFEFIAHQLPKQVLNDPETTNSNMHADMKYTCIYIMFIDIYVSICVYIMLIDTYVSVCIYITFINTYIVACISHRLSKQVLKNPQHRRSKCSHTCVYLYACTSCLEICTYLCAYTSCLWICTYLHAFLISDTGTGPCVIYHTYRIPICYSSYSVVLWGFPLCRYST